MEKIGFNDLYSMYLADEGEFFKSSPFLPKCKETKTDIFGEIHTLRAPNKPLYIAYLRKIDDIHKLVSYATYMRTIASTFELEVRKEMLSSDTESRIKVYKTLHIPEKYYDDMVSYWVMHSLRAKEYIKKGFKGLLFFTEHSGGILLPALVASYYEHNGVTVSDKYKGAMYNSSVLYVDETDIYFALQANEVDNFMQLAETKFLAIDDAYVGGDNGYMKTRLYRLLKKRMLYDLPTVIATQLSKTEMRTVDNRILNLIDDKDNSNTNKS